jgi:hypothetical protein
MASRLRALALFDISRVPPDADPLALTEEFTPIWDEERANGEGGRSGASSLRRAVKKLLGASVVMLYMARILCHALLLSSTVFLHLLLENIAKQVYENNSDVTPVQHMYTARSWWYAVGLGVCMLWWALMTGQYEYYIYVEVLKAHAMLSTATLHTTLNSLPGDVSKDVCAHVADLCVGEARKAAMLVYEYGEIVCFPFCLLGVVLLLCRQLDVSTIFVGMYMYACPYMDLLAIFFFCA